MIKIGSVLGWENDVVKVAVNNLEYTPSLGDLLYTLSGGNNNIVYTLMEIVGFEARTPEIAGFSGSPSLVSIDQLSQEIVVRAKLFLEITIDKNKKDSVQLVKASRPPALLKDVYLIKGGDTESEEIIRYISSYGGEEGNKIGIVVLRSGIAHNNVQAKEKHFINAELKVNLSELVKKHMLISGQTGSGKTSGIKGILLKYALDNSPRSSNENIGWLIIDRHGEYTPPEGCVKSEFIGKLVDSISLNEHLNPPSEDKIRTKVYTIRLVYKQIPKKFATNRFFNIQESPLKASSITLQDFAALREMSQEYVSLIEEFIMTLIGKLHETRETTDSGKTSTSKRIMEIDLFEKYNELFMKSENPEDATANMLALIPILYDNVIRYEEKKHEKSMRKHLLDKGIDIAKIRILRRLIFSTMKWRTMPIRTKITIHEKPVYVTIYVLDDSRSVVKVTSILKKPESLLCIFKRFATPGVNYPWNDIVKNTNCSDIPIDVLEEGIGIDGIVEQVNEGNIVIFDASRIEAHQADLTTLTLVRRIFESRLEKGFEEAKNMPIVGIVSEEAPLYLSRDIISSPFNPFARIAREGRKFNIGLIAITQIATLIEGQILANFNTIILLRTKYRGDIEYFRDLGIPVETLPYLGDREGFIYTPDLPIKEPIPMYIPAWFEDKYNEQLKNKEKKRKEISRLSEEDKKALIGEET